MNAAVCRELGKPLITKEVPLPNCNVEAGRKSCNRRWGEPKEGVAKVQLVAFPRRPLIPESNMAGGAIHLELIGHTIELEEGCASLPIGCGSGIGFNEQFAPSHEHTGDRLHLDMQVEPGSR
ncbi:MAG: hypothetical protein F4051_05270 [Boseongicola sp. SB0670_bin_30]|nr:hypothetical protein [Boseongicola sp. SB0670_bin_30]